jgi:hypothetical protein
VLEPLALPVDVPLPVVEDAGLLLPPHIVSGRSAKEKRASVRASLMSAHIAKEQEKGYGRPGIGRHWILAF